ncbi:hypothetical protein MHU86_21816 [Fragilaria crotonensis]|nr:hypothetical protein MHU86_21816 [Fragilaria crotonensis]
MFSAGQKRPRSCSASENVDDYHINKDDDKNSDNVTSPHPCLSFLASSTSTTDDSHAFSVHNSDSKTFGTILIANRDIPPHSLLFRLPSQFLVTHDAVYATELSQLIRDSVQHLNAPVKTSVSTTASCDASIRDLNDSNDNVTKNINNNHFTDDDNEDNNKRPTRQQQELQISPEELTWINMVYWRVSSEPTSHQIYLKSLSTVPPNVSSWSKSLQDCLIGTNVYAVLDDESAGNHEDDDEHHQPVVDGNVSVVKTLLGKLDQIRTVVGKEQLMTEQHLMERPQQRIANDSSTTNSERNPKWTDVILKVLHEDSETSIFTLESLGWARGHFLSRRFPATMKNLGTNDNDNNKMPNVPSTGMQNNNDHDGKKARSNSSTPKHHLAGYGNANSMFIPILDLMNHTPVRTNACSIEMTDDGMYLQVFTGDLPLQHGDELFYCYSSAAETGGLSNEILLQGYGFCLEDNPADTVSVKISTMGDGAQSRNTGSAFWIGRGGVSAIPSAMWRALAGSTKPAQGDVDDETKNDDDPIEIGSGDLNLYCST